MVTGGELVMSWAFAKVRGVNRPRCGEGFERAVDSAPRKSGLGRVQLGGNFLSRAVTAESHDGVVDHRPLSRSPHPWCEHQEDLTTRRLRSALVSTRQPTVSTTRSSSIRMPPQPGR